MDALVTYTFVCLAENQVATAVDVAALDVGAVRAHALSLLREHASAAAVEVWQDEGVVALIARDGVRPSHGRRPDVDLEEPRSDDNRIAISELDDQPIATNWRSRGRSSYNS